MEFLRYPQVIPAFFNIRVVRSSTVFYHRFNLLMGRSPGFGSTACNLCALLRLGLPSAPPLQWLNLATYRNSLARSTKSTWSHFLIVPPLLVSTRFQVLFHSPPGVLFTFPSRYYFAIGHQGIFRLGRWSSRLPTGFHVPRGTLVLSALTRISVTGLLPSLAALSNALYLYSSDRVRQSSTPDVRRLPVWPLPISLAATLRITFVFLSSGYLDVSVHRVPPIYLWIQYMVTSC